MATLCVGRQEASPTSHLMVNRFNHNLLNGKKRDIDLVKGKEVTLLCGQGFVFTLLRKDSLSTHVFPFLLNESFVQCVAS